MKSFWRALLLLRCILQMFFSPRLCTFHRPLAVARLEPGGTGRTSTVGGPSDKTHGITSCLLADSLSNPQTYVLRGGRGREKEREVNITWIIILTTDPQYYRFHPLHRGIVTQEAFSSALSISYFSLWCLCVWVNVYIRLMIIMTMECANINAHSSPHPINVPLSTYQSPLTQWTLLAKPPLPGEPSITDAPHPHMHFYTSKISAYLVDTTVATAAHVRVHGGTTAPSSHPSTVTTLDTDLGWGLMIQE